jgi:hypothetical protein
MRDCACDARDHANPKIDAPLLELKIGQAINAIRMDANRPLSQQTSRGRGAILKPSGLRLTVCIRVVGDAICWRFHHASGSGSAW